MIAKLQRKFALSEQGAKELIKSCVSCTVSYLLLAVPIGILYLFITQLIGPIVGEQVQSYSLTFYIVTIIVIFILLYIAHYIQYNSTFLSTYKESERRRTGLAEKLRKLPLSFFDKKDVADLTTTIMADCTDIEHAFSHWIPEFVGSIVSTVVLSIGLYFIDWKMAISATWCVPVSLFIVWIAKNRIRSSDENRTTDRIDSIDFIQEGIENVRDLKSNCAEAKYLEELQEKIEKAEKSTIKSELVCSIFVSTAQMVLKLGIGTVALVGSSLLIAGNLDIFTFILFLIVASRLYDPLNATLINLAAIVAMKTKIDRMNEINFCKVQTGNKNIELNNYDIQFNKVKFGYTTKDEVLKGISFTAKQGEVTALIGKSGSGKSTIAKLIARFFDSTSGSVFIGGKDVSTINPEKLLSYFSIVFQDVTLFNNSVMENIRIGRKGASDKEVIQAAIQANCDDFVSKLPNGYNTIIGENGSELSGGERQRISIARAILKDAPIILLDEATASLDAENETKIQEAISRLIKNKTVIIIAHRMRTVSGASKIVVIKDGVVAEEGSPQELYEKTGIYYGMVSSQTKSSKWKI